MSLRSSDWISDICFLELCGFNFSNLGKPFYFLKFSCVIILSQMKDLSSI